MNIEQNLVVRTLVRITVPEFEWIKKLMKLLDNNRVVTMAEANNGRNFGEGTFKDDCPKYV